MFHDVLLDLQIWWAHGMQTAKPRKENWHKMCSKVLYHFFLRARAALRPNHTAGWVFCWRCGCDPFATNQRETSSRAIGQFRFQGRVSSRHDRHPTCQPTISNLLGNRRTSKQGIPVTEVARRSWRLLTRPWNWNRPIARELISRWLVGNGSQPQRQRQAQLAVWFGLKKGRRSHVAKSYGLIFFLELQIWWAYMTYHVWKYSWGSDKNWSQKLSTIFFLAAYFHRIRNIASCRRVMAEILNIFEVWRRFCWVTDLMAMYGKLHVKALMGYCWKPVSKVLYHYFPGSLLASNMAQSVASQSLMDGIFEYFRSVLPGLYKNWNSETF